MPHNSQPDWNYTVRAHQEFGDTYGGRPLIGRDTPVRGGVYYGAYHGEAIVVDPERYPARYNVLYEKVIERSREQKKGWFGRVSLGGVRKDRVLQAVFDTVKEALPYSQAGVDKVLAETARDMGEAVLPDGTKVELEKFIAGKAGVCRHQALLCGALLEMAKDGGYISGSVSVDRNMQWSPNGEVGGHAWARYTNSVGDVYILDVAGNYAGYLEDTKMDPSMWNYLRPEEQQRAAAAGIGNMALRNLHE